MSIQLIVTCDDCGLSEGITQTTLRLHQMGMATTASVMTNFPATHHALDLFARYPALEVGVHLNLSDGYPLTKLPRSSDLTRPDGHFRDRYVLLAKSLFPSAQMLEQVQGELRAQIEMMLDAGIQPAHLTTHCHFHALPAMRDIVYALADEYKVKWVRSTDYRTTSVPYNLLLSKDTATEQPHSFLIPDYLVGMKHWLEQPPEQMLAEIMTLRGTIELVVHPAARNDVSFPADVRYSPPERYKETEYIEKFHALLQSTPHNIVVGSLLHEDGV
jgi:predicted glycoside hydrolase/deacetylase ChbG (UPF0249 family)